VVLAYLSFADTAVDNNLLLAGALPAAMRRSAATSVWGGYSKDIFSWPAAEKRPVSSAAWQS